MTKNLNAYASAKGYRILKTPVIVHLPIIGWVWLPTWLTFEWEYCSPKGIRYTYDGFVFKLKMKRDRRRRKHIIMENRRRMAIQFNQNI